MIPHIHYSGLGRVTKSFKTTQFHPFLYVQSSVPAELNWEPPTGVKNDYLYNIFIYFIYIFKYDICIFFLLLGHGLCAGERAAEDTLGEANRDPTKPCDPQGSMGHLDVGISDLLGWDGKSWIRDSTVKQARFALVPHEEPPFVSVQIYKYSSSAGSCSETLGK